jgi:hypothetical protein
LATLAIEYLIGFHDNFHTFIAAMISSGLLCYRFNSVIDADFGNLFSGKNFFRK